MKSNDPIYGIVLGGVAVFTFLWFIFIQPDIDRKRACNASIRTVTAQILEVREEKTEVWGGDDGDWITLVQDSEGDRHELIGKLGNAGETITLWKRLSFISSEDVVSTKRLYPF